MSDLSAKFAALTSDINANEAAANIDRDLTNTKLQALLDFLDIINENNAANTKAILAAMGQTGTCFPCPTPSVVVPPISTTPLPVNEDACKRAQAFLHAIQSILDAMDTMQSFNVIGTYNVVADAISEIIGGIISGSTPPLPSFPEAVNIVGDYVSYAGERVFSGIGLVEQFSPLVATLRNVLYSAGSGSAAISAYSASIDASSASNGAKLLFKALAYSSLASYYFDPSSTPDLTGYDGSVCTLPPGTCFDEVFVSFTVAESGAMLHGLGATFGPWTPIAVINTTTGTATATPPVFYAGDLAGWTIDVISGHAILAHRAEGPSSGAFIDTVSLSTEGGAYTVPFATGTWYLYGDADTEVNICSPSA